MGAARSDGFRYRRAALRVYWGHTRVLWGYLGVVYLRVIIPRVENQMDHKVEHETEATLYYDQRSGSVAVQGFCGTQLLVFGFQKLRRVYRCYCFWSHQ